MGRHHATAACRRPCITALLLALYSTALLSCTAAVTPHPGEQHQLDLFLTGVALHEATPVDAPGRQADQHGLAYVRCHPLSTATSYTHLDPQAVPHAFAAKADRAVGLHATAHIEAVGPAAEAVPTAEQLAGMNVYHLGDWADVHGSDLWCELHDIDRLRAGLLAPLGGGLLSIAAFADATSVDGAVVPPRHAVAVNLSRTLVETTDSVHVATLHFVCPLCGFGQQGTPEGVAAVWTATAFGAAVQMADDVGSGGSSDEQFTSSSSSHLFTGDTSDPTDPLMAAIREAIAAFDAHPMDDIDAGNHSTAVRDVLHWTIRASANHYHAQAAGGGDDAAALAEAQASRISGPDITTNHHHGSGPITAADLRDLEHEAHVVVSHAFKAAIKAGNDPAVAAQAVLNLAAGLAARFDAPYRVVRVDAPLPPHVEAAMAAHEARRNAGGEQHIMGTSTIVAVTLLASIVAFLAGYHGMNAYRAWAASRGGGMVVVRRLKRKDSNAPRPAATKGGAMPTMPEQDAGQLGTPSDTPRRVEQGGILSPR
jgi:hypothetical protein